MKLSEEAIEDVCRLVSEGHYVVTVCQMKGITRPTYYNWKDRGQEIEEKIENGKIKKSKLKKKDKLYLKFWQDIQKAEAMGEISNVSNIKKAGDEGDWRASAWLLEKKYPEKFGKKNKVELDAKVETKRTIEDIILGSDE
jgi:hypothetical protein